MPGRSRPSRIETQAFFKKQVFSTRIALRRGDIDDAGHVNNVNYFRFMEEARLAWYATLGVGG